MSDSYQYLISLLLKGKFKEADDCLLAIKSELSPFQKTWITSYSSYWRGLLESKDSSLFDKMFAYFLVKSSFLRVLISCLVTIAGVLVKIIGCRKKLEIRFRDRIIPELIHNRYGNFQKLTVQSFIWWYLDIESSPLWRNKLLGCLGHGFCCYGRFDLGLPLIKKAVNQLERYHLSLNLDGLINHESYGIYIEYLAGLVFQLDCAGKRRDARYYRSKFFRDLKTHDAYWAEMYLRAMQITLAIEMLDENQLNENAVRVQDMLGKFFNEKFGLRIAGTRSYLAAYSNDLERSRNELRNAEFYYQSATIPIELYRYHQIRAHIALVERDIKVAKYHAERSIGFASSLPGAEFQKCESELIFCEVMLQSQIWSTSPATDIIAIVKKRVNSIKKRVVGSELIDATIEVIERTIDYLEHRFDRVTDLALKAKLEEISPRMSVFYSSLVLRKTENRFITLENKSTIQEISNISLLNAAASKHSVGSEHEEVLRAILRADACKRAGDVKIADEQKDFLYQKIDEDNAVLTIAFSKNVGMCFHVRSPRVDLSFDRAAKEYLLLACTIVRECEAQRELMANSMNAAIARTTQMLAHDVRRPFSILRMGINMLGHAKDPAGVKDILARLVPEVDKALTHVDGMIADVMEIGSSRSNLTLEATSPEALIDTAIDELCRIYPKAKLSFTFSLMHHKAVLVNPHKVGRVFANILSNAVQAMKYHGEIWFKSRDSAEGFVEFCLGNSGSLIPAENLPRLFDAFFTSGKKVGTGLGLAIAQKVIQDHGGRIWCESSETLEHPNGQVEFYFRLPSTEEPLPPFLGRLPASSAEVISSLSLDSSAHESPRRAQLEDELEAEIRATTSRLNRPLLVLIIDDELLYRQGLFGSLTRAKTLADLFTIDLVASPIEAIEAMCARSYELIITDVDLGDHRINGFELVEKIRQNGGSGLICVHSNRVIAEDHRSAIACGADAFLPKPMPREHLLKLVLQATERAVAGAHKSSSKF